MSTYVPHGRYTGYTTGGCRCPRCTKAATSYNKGRVLRIQQGAWQPWTDAARAREHVARLRAAGFSIETIAELAGAARSSIESLMRDGRPKARTRFVEKILAVRPTLDDMPEWGKVDATGSRRRIQALVAAGWSPRSLADRLGVDRSMLRKLMARPTIRVFNARAIRDLFAQLSMQLPPNETRYERAAVTRARNLAARNGWAPALAWDDIDDPDAVPDLGESSSRLAALVENVGELIIQQGENPENVAERLGVSLSYLDKLRREYHRQAEAVDA